MQTLVIGSTGQEVITWQQYLNSQGYALTADGNFGPATEAATKNFQQRHGLVVDGEVGPITFNFAASLDEPAPNLIKSNLDVLTWIKQNLRIQITVAITGTSFTEDWLAALACRETGGLLTKYVNSGNTTVALLAPLMKGDYTNGEYHGYSFWQIDIRSFPDFINSGDWVNSQKAAVQAVSVLNTMKKSLIELGIAKYSLPNDGDDRATTASYNCGSGNVMKALEEGQNVDYFTANQNYSSQVFSFRAMYLSIK
jgi:hypothetical protein